MSNRRSSRSGKRKTKLQELKEAHQEAQTFIRYYRDLERTRDERLAELDAQIAELEESKKAVIRAADSAPQNLPKWRRAEAELVKQISLVENANMTVGPKTAREAATDKLLRLHRQLSQIQEEIDAEKV